MRGDSAWEMLTGLMDAAVADIARIAADGRHFDRQRIVQLADIWDNNTSNVFGVARIRPRWLRERSARKALRWMADMGEARRAWMISHGGEPMRRLLDGIGPDPLYSRDYADRVVPSRLPLAAAGLDADYDLDAAVVRSFALERRGREVGGHLTLLTPRRYADGVAELTVHLDGVRAARLTSTDSGGLGIAGDAELRVGKAGLVCATAATVTLDDRMWHRSRAGRTADALIPRRDPRSRRAPLVLLPVGEAAWAAARRFHDVMLQIRQVRHAEGVGRVPLAGLCAAVSGAGSRVRAAAEMPRSRQEQAYREMTERWRVPARVGESAGGLPGDAWLTLASYRAGEVVTNFARPHEDGWRVGASAWTAAGRFTASWADERLTIG
ncbi:hypothetical protein KZ829_18770 [Actinoplanes hulinensis]|uniref:Uncharacterized protein n=1 Tax=Actinoplanes hulinensis TaxID=1144547 RepID=A0ABS7B5R9_9ACTN|nr:hypothetical protein [Actinoplanes hulinensis]MBW6435789.1 hypothetical protein [Actinoplanes hulinensis]